MNTVRINGVTITTSGSRSVVVSNGRVIIDGKDVTPDGKQITIEVQGNVDRMEIDACDHVAVTGSVGSLSTQSGDVECGPVNGGVHTMSGDVSCEGDIAGSVQTMSGDVRAAGRIAGGATSTTGRVRV